MVLSAKGQVFRLHDSGTPVDIPFLSLEDCRWCYLLRVKFSGCMIPEHPLIYPAWVGERSDSRVGNAAL